MIIRKLTSTTFVTVGLLATASGATAAATTASLAQMPAPTAVNTARSNTFPTTYLQIVVDDGAGGISTRALTCTPAGGTHPRPQAACDTVAATGSTALPAVPSDAPCTDLDGGDQKARVIGIWDGRLVNAHLSRKGGCEIARWNALTGVLPALDGYTGVTW